MEWIGQSAEKERRRLGSSGEMFCIKLFVVWCASQRGGGRKIVFVGGGFEVRSTLVRVG